MIVLWNGEVVLTYARMTFALVVQVRENLFIQILKDKVNNSHSGMPWNENQ